MIALSVLAVVVLATTPGLPAFIGWALHQPWITIPALLLAAAWTWRPKATKRVLLTGVLLAHQAWTRRRQAKTATA
jgi:hypothetical protein